MPTLPPERVHLVTVPPPGGPSDQLWKRFAERARARARDAPYAESETTNASLGGAEVTMLRRLNAALREREVPRPVYVDWVRETIVKEVLARRPGKVPATVPPRRRQAGRADHRLLAGGDRGARASTSSVTSPTCEPVWPDDDGRWADPDQADPEVVAEPRSRRSPTCSPASAAQPVGEDDSGAVARLTRMLRS